MCCSHDMSSVYTRLLRCKNTFWSNPYPPLVVGDGCQTARVQYIPAQYSTLLPSYLRCRSA